MSDYSAQAHFGNYDPSSFGWPHAVPDLVPLVFDGVNFGQCARDVHPVFVALLTELVPLIPGGISFGAHDDWAYSTTDDLPDGSWSFHRYGLAFDLNWIENPMGTYSTNPDAGMAGAIPHAAASAIATKYGCEYGGDWSGGDGHTGFKDYMHFECHLSPDVARTVKTLAAPPAPALTIQEDDMAFMIDVSKTDAAAKKVAWPGVFLTDGITLRHVTSAADVAAFAAAGVKHSSKPISIAQFRELGGVTKPL
jgi:hypothetical protein